MSLREGPEAIPLRPQKITSTDEGTSFEQEVLILPPANFKAVKNITQPTLTVFLPDPAVATGTGIIICPGGAFHILAIEHEGTQLAHWLNARGVAAFVLKYRLMKITVNEETARKRLQDSLASSTKLKELVGEFVPVAVEDGLVALKVVRQWATEWGLRADRIGMLGFSAGGRLAVGVAIQPDSVARPDFAASIYGAILEDLSVPAGAPPLFLVGANDDDLTVEGCVQLYSGWRKAGCTAELHLYSKGGHGFGMSKQGLPVDNWPERFSDWLEQQGFGK